MKGKRNFSNENSWDVFRGKFDRNGIYEIEI